MSFLNPIGFIGLFSLPVILILHLLRERQRRYTVSSLELWSFLQNEIRGPRVRRIPLTWLLFLDLLIAAALSLAWTQPQITAILPAPAARHRVVLIDVSTSMLADDGGMSRFDRARRDAAQLIETGGRRDITTLIAFGTRARIVADSRQGGSQAVIFSLNQLAAGETGAALREGLALGQAAIDHSLPDEFTVFTDGALPNSAAFTAAEFDRPLNWRMIGRPADNQGIIGLSATRLGDGSRVQIFSRIGNFAGRPAAREIRLELDGRELLREKIAVAPESSLPRVWEIETNAGSKAVTITLVGNDALREDDIASIGLDASGKTRVALVSEDPGMIRQAVQSVPGAQLEVFSPDDYELYNGTAKESAGFDLTIFRGHVPNHLPRGTTLIFEPAPTGGADDASDSDGAFRLPVGVHRTISPAANVRVASANSLLDGMDFSGVRWSRVRELTPTPTWLQPLLMADDTPLIAAGYPENAGKPRFVIVVLADLSASNFIKHPAFPIFIAGVIQAARTTTMPPTLQTGEAIRLPLLSSLDAIRLIPPNGSPVSLNTSWPVEWTETHLPGLYSVELISGSESDVVVLGANAGSPSESDLRTSAWVRAVRENAPGQPGLQTKEPEPVNLWPLLLAAALLLLLGEARLAWRS